MYCAIVVPPSYSCRNWDPRAKDQEPILLSEDGVWPYNFGQIGVAQDKPQVCADTEGLSPPVRSTHSFNFRATRSRESQLLNIGDLLKQYRRTAPKNAQVRDDRKLWRRRRRTKMRETWLARPACLLALIALGVFVPIALAAQMISC